MQVLTEQVIIEAIKQEWHTKLVSLAEEAGIKIDAKLDGENTPVVSSGLKVKKDGLLYTVVSVGKDEVVLKTPEGQDFVVKASKFEEYELA